MARSVNDVLKIMRLAISRRNANDPDSSDETLLSYLNDFVSLTMGNEVRLFEQYTTLTFSIDDTTETGVYTFNDVGADTDLESISGNGFISLTDSPFSWTPLKVCFNPESFFNYWGIDNEDELTTGMPTDVLFYGNELTFRTIPDTEYTVTLYGYKKQADFSDDGDEILNHDYWLRFLAYGAAVNYGMDYRFAEEVMAPLRRDYARERRLMLTHTHNQIKFTRCVPSF